MPVKVQGPFFAFKLHLGFSKLRLETTAVEYLGARAHPAFRGGPHLLRRKVLIPRHNQAVWVQKSASAVAPPMQQWGFCSKSRPRTAWFARLYFPGGVRSDLRVSQADLGHTPEGQNRGRTGMGTVRGRSR